MSFAHRVGCSCRVSDPLPGLAEYLLTGGVNYFCPTLSRLTKFPQWCGPALLREHLAHLAFPSHDQLATTKLEHCGSYTLAMTPQHKIVDATSTATHFTKRSLGLVNRPGKLYILVTSRKKKKENETSFGHCLYAAPSISYILSWPQEEAMLLALETCTS